MTTYRRVLRNIRLTSILGLPLLAQVASAGIPSQYRITDLGSLGGGWTFAEAINNATPAQVTGNSWLSDGTSHAFIYTAGGSIAPLNTGTSEQPYATGINDDGDIVGEIGTGAFVYHDGVVTLLPPLPGFNRYQVVYGINNNGQVAGAAYSDTSDDIHAFRYSLADDSMLDIGTGNIFTEAYAINNQGQLAGYLLDATNWTQQAMFYDGTLLDIDPNNSWGSFAYDLNDSAQVVGFVSIDLGGGYFDDRAFIYDHDSSGTMTLLPGLPGSTWSEARGINNLGQVVGLSLDGTNQHATLWSDDQLVDLTTMLEPSPLTPHVQLERAEDINDNGWIIARGYDTRTWEIRSYLLEPLWP